MSMQNPLEKLAEAAAVSGQSQARALLGRFFDEGTFVEIDRLAMDGDKPAEAAAGYGLVGGMPAYAFAQDKTVCSGAIGKAQAAKISKIYELAAQNGAPIVGFFDSDGAKLGEGMDAMEAIAQILFSSNSLSGVVPQIAVITGACVGTSALVAATSDLVVMVEGGSYYLSKDGEGGQADVLARDETEALEKAKALLSYLPSNNLSAPPVYENAAAPMGVCADTADCPAAVADPGTLLLLSDNSACKTAFGQVDGVVCGIVTLSGEAICDRTASRTARFVRLCDAFSLPVLTFVDAAGFQGVEGAAKISQAYAEATTAKISIITGKAYGPVYIAVAGKLAGADAVLAWPQAVISPLSPETAVQILWRDRLAAMQDPTSDREALAAEYAAEEGSPLKAAAGGYLTDVVTTEETKNKITALLDMLSGKRVSRLPKKHINVVL